MTPPASLPAFPTTKAVLRLSAATGAMGVLALITLYLTGRPEQMVGVLAAAGVCLLAALFSIDIMRRSVAGHLQRVVLASMVTFPLRVVVVGAGVTAVAAGLGAPVLPLALWTLFFYLVLLGAEAGLVVAYIRDATAADPLAPMPHLAPDVKGSPRHA